MASLKAHGTELYRFFSPKRGGLMAVMSDGVTLRKTPLSSGWKIYSRKKPEVSMADWRASVDRRYEKTPQWCKDVKSIPSFETLQRWNGDCVCETPTGHTVEPDGEGPDGVPSWLRLFRLI